MAAWSWPTRVPRTLAIVLVVLCLSAVRVRPGVLDKSDAPDPPAAAPAASADPADLKASPVPARFARMLREQAATDEAWREASAGFMRMEKTSYSSRADGLAIPAFVFEPLEPAPFRSRPGLVWVHENIRGHLYEHFIPYVREATRQGYVVIAPEYRGSIGYGQDFYDAIDYGGAEVDDVVTAANVLAERYPSVDPGRVGIIGWSHGGLIALLAVFRNPSTFTAAGAIVPVVNLFHRLASKGVARQLAAIDPHNRFGGGPSERPALYKERSPLFHVDILKTPLLVHAAGNDEDVEIEEAMQLIDALRARKRGLAEIKVYKAPRGGHTFDRQVKPGIWRAGSGREQQDSWLRVWRFFGRHLADEAAASADPPALEPPPSATTVTRRSRLASAAFP